MDLLRRTRRRTDPKKSVLLPLGAHATLTVFARECGFRKLDALVRLIQFGVHYWRVNDKPILTGRIQQQPIDLMEELRKH